MMMNTGWEFVTDVLNIKDVVDDAHLDCDKDALNDDFLNINYPSAPAKQACDKDELTEATKVKDVRCAEEATPAPVETTQAPNMRDDSGARPSTGPVLY